MRQGQIAALLRPGDMTQWLLNVGRRDGMARIAHLLCELYSRMAAVRLARANQCDLPLSQADLADALACTPVYIHRLLRDLRVRELATFQRHRLVIEDFEQLRHVGDFGGDYLNGDAWTV